MNNDLLMVGSIPLDTAEDVFKMFGKPLGRFMPAVPDGEVGPRKHWISRVHYQVLAGHPELDIVRRPRPENGVERPNPRDASDSWQFKVKDGIDHVRFGDPGWRLGYARDAINSYFVFKTMRDQGKLPAHLRFQVSLGSVNSTLPARIFPDVNDLNKIHPGFEAALGAEVAKIVEKIPNQDLAIQWDCATEVQDAYGAIPGFSADTAIERSVAPIRRLSPKIPETVALGYHLCFGTLGGWPRFQPNDLSGAVKLAARSVVGTGIAAFLGLGALVAGSGVVSWMVLDGPPRMQVTAPVPDSLNDALRRRGILAQDDTAVFAFSPAGDQDLTLLVVAEHRIAVAAPRRLRGYPRDGMAYTFTPRWRAGPRFAFILLPARARPDTVFAGLSPRGVWDIARAVNRLLPGGFRLRPPRTPAGL